LWVVGGESRALPRKAAMSLRCVRMRFLSRSAMCRKKNLSLGKYFIHMCSWSKYLSHHVRRLVRRLNAPMCVRVSCGLCRVVPFAVCVAHQQQTTYMPRPISGCMLARPFGSSKSNP
jgi:hypothetical protein